MSTHTPERSASVEFQQASTAATTLAERIAQCGRNHGSNAEMVVLLKAWQEARMRARVWHARMLAETRVALPPHKRVAVG